MNKIARFFVRILQYLSFPFVGIEFLFRYVSALNKSRNYVNDPEKYLAESRYKTVYILVSRIFYFKGIKIVDIGFENVPKKPVLFVMNHKSNIDPLLLIQILNHYKEYPLVTFVAKEELLQKKIGKILRLIDVVFIKRDNIRQMSEALESQEKIIRSNISLGIYPEGTRIPGNIFGEFKGGALKVAYRTFVPIVPVLICNSEGKMEHNKKDLTKKFKKSKGYKIYVKFFKPLQPISFINMQSNMLANNIRDNLLKEFNDFKINNEKNKK